MKAHHLTMFYSILTVVMALPYLLMPFGDVRLKAAQLGFVFMSVLTS
jgi:uncharacterized MnhB-related membrane protein